MVSVVKVNLEKFKRRGVGKVKAGSCTENNMPHTNRVFGGICI